MGIACDSDCWHLPSLSYHYTCTSPYFLHLHKYRKLKHISGHIDKLPREILHQILWSISPRLLKSVRLCCKRWSSVITECIFEQIYFIPHSESISRFENIIQDSKLANCVKHLVFDDTQLSRRLLRQGLHSMPLGEVRTWSLSEQVAALETLDHCRLNQEHIMATSMDLTVLLQGLPKLSNLKTISVIRGPSHLYWPETPTGPQPQDLAHTKVAVSHWSYCKEKKSWRSNRVQQLLQGLSSTKTGITGLHIGNWQDHARPLKMGLPLGSFLAPNAMDQARFMTTIQSVFSHLTKLSLQIDLGTEVKGHDRNERYLDSLFQILSSTTRVERFAFGVTQSSFAFDVHHTQRLLNNTWPALVSIKLRGVRVDRDTLLDFFARHKDTLTILSFLHVGFEPNTPYTWLDVAQQGGQLLHLDFAELDVYEWGKDSDISGWQLESNEADLAAILGGG